LVWLDAAATKWLARYHAEVEGVTLTEIRELAELLGALPTHGLGRRQRGPRHFEQRGLYRCADRVRSLVLA
jgi:hypothetical protein